MTVLPNIRPLQIADEVSRVISAVITADMACADIYREHLGAMENTFGVREGMMMALAVVAERDGWLREEITEGIARALSQRNTVPKSIETLVSELQLVCRPGVRQLSSVCRG